MTRVRVPSHLFVAVLVVAGLVAPTAVVGWTAGDAGPSADVDPRETDTNVVERPFDNPASDRWPETTAGAPSVPTANSTTSSVEVLTGPPNGSNTSAGVGRQLATVVTAASDEVATDVEGTAFESAFRRAGESGRADLIADRAEELAGRAGDLRDEYAELTEAYRGGDLGESAFAFQVALLNSRAINLRESIDRLEERARNVSAAELRAAGLERSTLPSARRDLATVTGLGARAVFERFTGELPDEADLDIEAGETSLTITVHREDGERSREYDAARDADAGITISESAAQSAARSALSDTDGRWVLTRSRVRRDDGYYAFEFEVRGNATTGEAEVSVDGSTGRVFHLEEEIEPADDGDEDDTGGDEDDVGDDGDDRRDREPTLEMNLVDGTPGPGETVTVQVLSDGDPAPNATVFLEGDPVGRTGSDGTLRVELPPEGPKLEALYGDAEAELEFDYDPDDGEDTGAFAVAATYDDGTVTVSVTRGGEGVAGVVVEANGETAGRTDADGELSFTVEDGEELDLELTGDGVEVEREYLIRDGSLVPEDG